ncbi:MAG: tetratricopeptide repeat protein [Phycisphaerae bacterium]|nr:tetratricopeptide repeat protein [Phycisphaerae bacterium]
MKRLVCGPILLCGLLSYAETNPPALPVQRLEPLINKAEQGDMQAQYDLASTYYFGVRVATNYEAALKWFRMAAEGGLSRAQYRLGYMYYKGQGVDTNLEEAVKWFKKAATQGDAKAASLAAMLERQVDPPNEEPTRKTTDPGGLWTRAQGRPTEDQARAEAHEPMANSTALLSEDEYLDLPDDQIDVAQAALTIAKGIRRDLDIRTCLEQVDRIAAPLKAEVRRACKPQDLIDAINAQVFQKQGFVAAPEHTSLDELLETKSGACMALSTLYLALADRLRLPIAAVIAPDHMFVRYEDHDCQINVETTLEGQVLPNRYYIDKFNIAPGSLQRGVYLRPLTRKQLLACLINYRGVVHFTRGEHAEAIADYTKSIGLSPDYAEAYGNRATVYNELGQYDKAMQDAEQMLALDPNRAAAYTTRGNIYEHQGAYQRAIEDHRTAISLDPTYAAAYVNLGNIYSVRLGQREEAVSYYNRAALLAPDKKEVYKNRGIAYHGLGRDENAMADFNKLISLDPRYPNGYFYRAGIYMLRGDLSEAMSDLNKAISLDPEYAEAYRWRALAHSMRGDRKNMLQDLRRAFEIDPALKKDREMNEMFEAWQRDPDFQALLR